MGVVKDRNNVIEADGIDGNGNRTKVKPLVSIILSAYNEATIIEENLAVLLESLNALEDKFDWEILIINDGSTDNTGALGELFAKENPKIKVFHHRKNRGLGKGLQTGIDNSLGDYVITLDIDLSISPENIARMLEKIIETKVKVVIGSPMLEGAKMEGMPWYRRFLTIWANKFLSFIVPGRISTLTCMARAYDGEFLRSLNLRSMGMEIMPEILYKTMIMHENIEEIPVDLIWNTAENSKGNRVSSMGIYKHTIATLFTGFLLKPFLFFILPGLLLFLFSLYPITWMLVHFFNEYATAAGPGILERSSRSIEVAYQLHPHTFLVAFFSLLLAIQLIAVGFQSLQNKHYFEEVFNLVTKLYRKKN